MKKVFTISTALVGEEKVTYGDPILKLFRIYADVIEAISQTPMAKRQKDVLSGLLYFNSLLYSIEPDHAQRWATILSTEFRNKIKGIFDLSDANFQNLLTALKKNNMFIGDSVPEKYCMVISHDLKQLPTQIDILFEK